jgi:2-hydroxychromene-2-carboxylate isomerase
MSMAFYGDFNCPFCFAEHERLVTLGVYRDVPFKGIEHRPQLSVPWDLTYQKAVDEVTGDTARLRERAPDVQVSPPPTMPNTKAANTALAEAVLLEPQKAPELRLLIFRALWQQGRDISDDAVLEELWATAELPTRPMPPTREAKRRAKLWTTEWKNGPFDERIPVLANNEGQRLLGLAVPEEIEQFLTDNSRGAHNPDVCKA